MVSVRQFQVTFDCTSPERVALFWCEALGYVVPPPPEGFADWDELERTLPAEKHGAAYACVDPTGVGPRLYFQRVPEGKVVKNRVHLDVRVGTGLVGAERLAALSDGDAPTVGDVDEIGAKFRPWGPHSPDSHDSQRMSESTLLRQP